MNKFIPFAASLDRTDAVCKKVEDILKKTPGVKYYTTVIGFSTRRLRHGTEVDEGAPVARVLDEASSCGADRSNNREVATPGLSTIRCADDESPSVEAKRRCLLNDVRPCRNRYGTMPGLLGLHPVTRQWIIDDASRSDVAFLTRLEGEWCMRFR